MYVFLNILVVSGGRESENDRSHNFAIFFKHFDGYNPYLCVKKGITFAGEEILQILE